MPPQRRQCDSRGRRGRVRTELDLEELFRQLCAIATEYRLRLIWSVEDGRVLLRTYRERLVRPQFEGAGEDIETASAAAISSAIGYWGSRSGEGRLAQW